MRKFILILLLATFCAPVMADETFTHPNLGFSIKYPQDWTLERQNMAAFLVTYPGKDVLEKRHEHFRLEVIQLSGNGGNSMIAEMDRRSLESRYPQMKLVKSEATKAGNVKDGHMFEFAGKHQGRPFKLTRVIGFEGRRAYKFTFVGTEYNYNKLKPKVQKMIASFKAK